MARIRTIKPEFWTDERLTECSLSARLMFIGMWNFADDNGNMGYSAKRIKMQVFPADNIETQPLIEELLTHGMLTEYSVNGEKFLNIKGFGKHQVINRPSSTAIPKPEFNDDSVRTHGVLTDGREGKGREGIGDISSGSSPIPTMLTESGETKTKTVNKTIPDCPHADILALWAEKLPVAIQPADWNEKRQHALRSRWREKPNRQKLEWWARFFEYIGESDFLMGRTNTPGRKAFALSLDWLCKSDNFLKVIEGRFHEQEGVSA